MLYTTLILCAAALAAGAYLWTGIRAMLGHYEP